MKALEGSRRRKEAGTRCMGAKRAANLLGWSPADPGRAGHPQEGRLYGDRRVCEAGRMQVAACHPSRFLPELSPSEVAPGRRTIDPTQAQKHVRLGRTTSRSLPLASNAGLRR